MGCRPRADIGSSRPCTSREDSHCSSRSSCLTRSRPGSSRWGSATACPSTTWTSGGSTTTATRGCDPIGAPEPKPGKASSPPPDFVLKALTRLHPELRRRAKTARRVLADEIWHEDLDRWENELRAEFLERGLLLQAERIDEVDDAALLDHLQRVRTTSPGAASSTSSSCRCTTFRSGDCSWRAAHGASTTRRPSACSQAAPPRRRASTAALARIAAACRAAGVEPTSLDDIRSAGQAASRALDDYLADNAWRVVTEYTPRGLALIEQPDVLVKAIRMAGTTVANRADVDPGSVRKRVPAADRRAVRLAARRRSALLRQSR